jgi:hypothetical protein
MTDGAALPLALSDLVAELRQRNLIDATITCGHAFGGDYEAVSIHSALVVARRIARADAVVVAMGPGIVGTATRLGFSGIEVGPVLDAAAGLGGTPIACLRASSADPRPRHHGVSHHSVTALTVATRSTVLVPIATIGGPEEDEIRKELARAGIEARHEIVPFSPVGIVDALDAAHLQVVSMGRSPRDDPVLFEMAAVAGVCAAARVVPT